MVSFSIVISMIMLGVGLSMDSLALSVSCGLQPIANKKTMAVKVSLIFALVQATTPLIGYLIGQAFAQQIESFDHWIALVMLCLIGGHMIKESLSHKKDEECTDSEKKLTLLVLFTMGIATSIDALAAGVSLIATDLPLIPTIGIIFITTALFSLFGYISGHKLGTLFQSRAELFGGLVLIGLGIKIVIEHLLA